MFFFQEVEITESHGKHMKTGNMDGFRVEDCQIQNFSGSISTLVSSFLEQNGKLEGKPFMNGQHQGFPVNVPLRQPDDSSVGVRAIIGQKWSRKHFSQAALF